MNKERSSVAKMRWERRRDDGDSLKVEIGDSGDAVKDEMNEEEEEKKTWEVDVCAGSDNPNAAEVEREDEELRRDEDEQLRSDEDKYLRSYEE